MSALLQFPGATPQQLADTEAERGFLGSIMFDNSHLDRLTVIPGPDDFFEPFHSRVFALMMQVRRNGVAANPATLRPHLATDTALLELGGAGYLARLCNEPLALLPPDGLAARICSLADLRRTRATLIEALEACNAPDASPDAILDAVLAQSSSIVPTRAGLPLIDMIEWNRPAPDRLSAWGDWVPLLKTTLLTGEGGVGKSLFAQSLLTAVALGKPFLGMKTLPGPALYLTAEDDADELWRRQRAICKSLHVDVADLAGRLHLVSLDGEADTAFVHFDQERRMLPTDRWRQVRQTAGVLGIRYFGFDNATDLMGGDHNDVHEVAGFVNLLTGLAIEHNGATLILHHPNKAGADWLGSVAWHNKVRSRLILKRAEGSDEDARTVENPKANYGPSGRKVEMRWHHGAFVLGDDLAPDEQVDWTATIQASGDNDVFLRCLDERNRQRRPVSEKVSSRTFGPREFTKMPESRGIGRDRLEQAMDRLFRIGVIEAGFLYRDSGEGKDRFGLRRIPADLSADLPLTSSADLPLTARSAPLTTADTHPSPTEREGTALEAAAPSPDQCESKLRSDSQGPRS